MPKDRPIRKILIYRLGSLGDTVVALPCFHLIARQFPDAERRLLTNFPVHSKAPAAAAVLGESGLVHGYMRYRVGTRRLDELMQLVWEVRRFSPDLVVFLRDLKNWRRDAAFFKMCGVDRIVGLPAEGTPEVAFEPATGLYEPQARQLAKLISELGDAKVDDPESWSLHLSSGERETAKSMLREVEGRPLIVCGPGTKMQAKDWGEENWQALLGRLTWRYPNHALAMVGAGEDAETSERAARDWKGPKVNLCGKLSPRETAAVLEHAEIFLGPDSGPMHLAASVGVSCAIAFSARGMPGVWFPAGNSHQIVYHRTECYGCELETCIENKRKCLTSITVEEMEQAAMRILGRPQGMRAQG